MGCKPKGKKPTLSTSNLTALRQMLSPRFRQTSDVKTERGLCPARFYILSLIINMAKEKMSMPQSTAGLIRYFDASKESIKMKPEHILGVCVVIIALELLIKVAF